ncbi:hypothetical protein QP166_00400 [Sphingomonas sp. LR60]|uniref:hypothetical protein n=1 Tax=Sphingomonas sp. LR60 TaxID=3050233 RepID=UPI002FE07F66
MTAGERVLAAAQQLVGVRFRVQGRDPALGLDCVGLVAVALWRAGAAVTVPRDYAVARGRLPTGVEPARVFPNPRPACINHTRQSPGGGNCPSCAHNGQCCFSSSIASGLSVDSTCCCSAAPSSSSHRIPRIPP